VNAQRTCRQQILRSNIGTAPSVATRNIRLFRSRFQKSGNIWKRDLTAFAASAIIANMARTAQEHLDALLEQRDLLVDQLSNASGYRIADRSVTREEVSDRLKDLEEILIPRARKDVSGSKGPARNLLNLRRVR